MTKFLCHVCFLSLLIWSNTRASADVLGTLELSVNPSTLFRGAQFSADGGTTKKFRYAGIFDNIISEPMDFSGIFADVYTEGAHVLEYCLAFNIDLPFSDTYSTEVKPVTDVIPPSRVSDIYELYSRFYSDSLTSKTKAAGFQTAIWEIMNENEGSYDATDGNFLQTLGDTAISAQANAYLGALTGGFTSSPFILTAFVLENFEFQTLIHAIAVPEINSFTSVGLLLGFFLIARQALSRRKKKAGTSLIR